VEFITAHGTQWAVFESNDEPLGSQIRLDVGEFINDLFFQQKSNYKKYKNNYGPF
jgi:hypothetical protein